VQTITFEDELVHQLFPITLARPAYAMLCGSYRLVDWIEQLDQAPQAVVRDYLIDLQEADYPCFRKRPDEPPRKHTMWINARLVPSRHTFETLCLLRDRGETGIVHSGSAVAVAIVPSTAPALPAELRAATLHTYFEQLGLTELQPLDADLRLIDYPHQLIQLNQDTLTDNLQHRLRTGQYEEVADGVFAAEGATLGAHVVADTRTGPIVLESHASVGPFAFLAGPAHLGRHTRVIEHAAIKDFVTIGHTAKIGGEVEASVIESYTNKQHHGFLGHSYLGSWINLGAGTCNSDLKNTYGEVKMEYAGHKVATGMQFVGCVMGDYAKSAINTGIFTGKTVGVCSMLYGFVTTNVPSFVNYARLFGQVTELPPDVMIATQRRMFARRKVTQRPLDQQLIRDMYALTRDERQLGGDPLLL
jgi:UDP-N-acetylglucosamine diphosphorylase / glucose-1-phosphate thymidylyltransferase / UDP-N-acetylgalactosamine diphosphorylase / glucosamine-1-phosphate N-acetyltransferase / galactosamine-1-phosphate N-acetyltransferase